MSVNELQNIQKSEGSSRVVINDKGEKIVLKDTRGKPSQAAAQSVEVEPKKSEATPFLCQSGLFNPQCQGSKVEQFKAMLKL